METRDDKGRWLSGVSPNPSGRPAVSDEERQMRENFKKAFIALGTKTMDELKEMAEDPKQPVVYAMQAKALWWFYKNGNPAIYRELLDRTMGKVTQTVDLEVSNPYQQMPLEQLKELVKKRLDE